MSGDWGKIEKNQSQRAIDKSPEILSPKKERDHSFGFFPPSEKIHTHRFDGFALAVYLTGRLLEFVFNSLLENCLALSLGSSLIFSCSW